jgi:putative glutamine amidotransferase
MKAPLIAVTGLTRAVSGVERSGVNSAYVRSVLRAGGIPLILSPLIDAELLPRALDAADGLLLTGGEDLDPAHYGEEPHPGLDVVDARRDAFELAAFRIARERQLPTLAICRGLQVVNVAMGGTLWQDLPTQNPSDVTHRQLSGRDDRTHQVDVTSGSRLEAALASARVKVNSFHHQAIRQLARGLKVSGVAPDGLIEAVESEADPWLLAVQWHPEEFHHEAVAPDAGLFDALIREAARSPAAAGS